MSTGWSAFLAARSGIPVWLYLCDFTLRWMQRPERNTPRWFFTLLVYHVTILELKSLHFLRCCEARLWQQTLSSLVYLSRFRQEPINKQVTVAQIMKPCSMQSCTMTAGPDKANDDKEWQFTQSAEDCVSLGACSRLSPLRADWPRPTGQEETVAFLAFASIRLI